MGIEGNKNTRDSIDLAERIARAKQVMDENREVARPPKGAELGFAAIGARSAYGKAEAELAALLELKRLTPDIDITDPDLYPVDERVDESNFAPRTDSLVASEDMGEGQIRVGDYSAVLLRTASGNAYLIEKIADEKYKLTNIGDNMSLRIQSDLIIKRDEPFVYGKYGSSTSPIVSWTTKK